MLHHVAPFRTWALAPSCGQCWMLRSTAGCLSVPCSAKGSALRGSPIQPLLEWGTNSSPPYLLGDHSEGPSCCWAPPGGCGNRTAIYHLPQPRRVSVTPSWCPSSGPTTPPCCPRCCPWTSSRAPDGELHINADLRPGSRPAAPRALFEQDMTQAKSESYLDTFLENAKNRQSKIK